jgi:hypothetical protein
MGVLTHTNDPIRSFFRPFPSNGKADGGNRKAATE